MANKLLTSDFELYFEKKAPAARNKGQDLGAKFRN